MNIHNISYHYMLQKISVRKRYELCTQEMSDTLQNEIYVIKWVLLL